MGEYRLGVRTKVPMYFFVDEVFWLCLGHEVFLPSLAKEELLLSLCVQKL